MPPHILLPNVALLLNGGMAKYLATTNNRNMTDAEEEFFRTLCEVVYYLGAASTQLAEQAGADTSQLPPAPIPPHWPGGKIWNEEHREDNAS